MSCVSSVVVAASPLSICVTEVPLKSDTSSEQSFSLGNMRISVTDEEGGLTFSLEICDDTTLETLRALIEVESGIPIAQQLLFVDMKPINAAAETVAAAGIADGCLILLARAAAPEAAAVSFAGAAPRSSSSAAAAGDNSVAAVRRGGAVEGAAAQAAATSRAPPSSSRSGGGNHLPDFRSLFDFSNIVVKDGRATTPAAARSVSRGGARGQQQRRGGRAAGGGGGGHQQQQQLQEATVSADSSAAVAGSSSSCGDGGRERTAAGGERQGENSAAAADEEYLQQQAETLVNVCAADASTMAVLVAENEALAAVLPEAVKEAKTQSSSKSAFEGLKQYLRKQLQERRKAEEARVEALNAALADPLSAKAQSFMMQQIQAQQVEDNYLLAQEHLPEAFGHVFMLYVPIEINGVAVKAFVDSGAQGTFMSQSCAQRCNLTRLMDTRYQGTALGVGRAQILGRIHLATLKIGQRFYPSSFTVLQDEKIPFLLGLDLLRRYQCCIDLKKNVLRIDDDEVPFLGEKDIDKNAFGGERSEIEPEEQASVPDTNGASTASSSSSSFVPSPPVSQEPQGTQKQDNAASSPTLESQSSTTSLDPQDDAKVQQLVDLGFFRTDAVDALSQAGGNVEAAASFLLHEQQRIHRGSI